jgi:hypothetical protein
VNAEVFFVSKRFGKNVRNSSYAAFDSAAVLDEPGNILADALQGFVRLSDGRFDDVLIIRDQQINCIDVEETVPKGAGHFIVDLSYDISGIGGGGLDYVDGNAETA